MPASVQIAVRRGGFSWDDLIYLSFLCILNRIEESRVRELLIHLQIA